MSRAQVSKHYARILSQWPADNLRPEVQFQNILKQRVERAPIARPLQQNTAQVQSGQKARSPEAEEINALYSLLENRYSKQFPNSESLLHPSSTPKYYDNLSKELEEAPTRSWFGNFMKRITNMVRLQ